MDIEERVAQLEFQLGLLYNGSDIDRYIYETGITRSQYTAIQNLLDELRNKLDKGEDINHSVFEMRVYELIPKKYGDYHFCELITKLYAENGQWEEVFPALYGDLPKFKNV